MRTQLHIRAYTRALWVRHNTRTSNNGLDSISAPLRHVLYRSWCQRRHYSIIPSSILFTSRRLSTEMGARSRLYRLSIKSTIEVDSPWPEAQWVLDDGILRPPDRNENSDLSVTIRTHGYEIFRKFCELWVCLYLSVIIENLYFTISMVARQINHKIYKK